MILTTRDTSTVRPSDALMEDAVRKGTVEIDRLPLLQRVESRLREDGWQVLRRGRTLVLPEVCNR